MPVSITQWATPYSNRTATTDWGFFVQDQWTIERLTLNYGRAVRLLQRLRAGPDVPATPNGWVPARDFDAVEDVPLVEGLSIRASARRTTCSATAGRRSRSRSDGTWPRRRSTITSANNPIATSVNTVTPDVDRRQRQLRARLRPGEPAANGECGAMSNLNFGGPQRHHTVCRRRDPRLRRARLQLGHVAEVQHQLGAACR